MFHFFSGEAVRNPGEKLNSIRDRVEVDVMREPWSVVSLITPWNFPSAILALAAGNAVVMKPAELTPGCVHLLVEVLEQAGCPAGVFNLPTVGVDYNLPFSGRGASSLGSGGAAGRQCRALRRRGAWKGGRSDPVAGADVEIGGPIRSVPGWSCNACTKRCADWA